MTGPGKAVFLSYASQDAPAAERLCKALRAAGVEVWFDQSELRGGDTWDASIRRQIKTCYLFMPMISANTQAREEGYFRREWNLAVDRTGDMAGGRVFLLPVVIDGTSDSEALVPEKFREVHWTRLPQGANADLFVEHVRRLLSGDLSREPVGGAPVVPHVSAAKVTPIPASWRMRAALFAPIAMVLALGYFVINRWVLPKHSAEMGAVAASAAQNAPATRFSPPPHSIGVLPFVNMSEDKEQEYFSEGLTEELLNSLADINELQVAARTSSFSFQGEHPDIATVAHKLNVASVLEGSVRRSGHTVRITAQLIDAVTGFHLWSKTYDRDLGDVLKLQTEFATAVAEALKVTLLDDISSKIELGGTRNPAAFDAYLRASKAYQSFNDAAKDIPPAIAQYTEAIRLDSNYALAFAARSLALNTYTVDVTSGAAARTGYEKAESDARQAIALAPGLAEAHLALALVFESTFDFQGANGEYERALALAPGNARVQRGGGTFAAEMGRFEVAIAAARRAVVLDPLSRGTHAALGQVLYFARRYGEAASTYAEAIRLFPGFKAGYARRGLALYLLGDSQNARDSCETKRDLWEGQQCLAVLYNKLARQADAEAELAKIKSTLGDAAAYQYAEIYAQWGDRAKALEWLDRAMLLRDSGLEYLKIDPLMDPLRNEPRFQAVMRELKFPD